MADSKMAALEAVGVDVTEGLQYCRNNEKIFLFFIYSITSYTFTVYYIYN